jgi:hypothetical protein
LDIFSIFVPRNRKGILFVSARRTVKGGDGEMKRGIGEDGNGDGNGRKLHADRRCMMGMEMGKDGERHLKFESQQKK